MNGASTASFRRSGSPPVAPTECISDGPATSSPAPMRTPSCGPSQWPGHRSRQGVCGKPLRPQRCLGAPDGGLYFTIRSTRAPGGSTTKCRRQEQHVYFLSPDRQKLTRVGQRPDPGPMASSAGPTADSFSCPISAPGRPIAMTSSRIARLSKKTLLCLLGSDGMTLDNEEESLPDRQGRPTIFDPMTSR